VRAGGDPVGRHSEQPEQGVKESRRVGGAGFEVDVQLAVAETAGRRQEVGRVDGEARLSDAGAALDDADSRRGRHRGEFVAASGEVGEVGR
jgi:hypothetical protein